MTPKNWILEKRTWGGKNDPKKSEIIYGRSLIYEYRKESDQFLRFRSDIRFDKVIWPLKIQIPSFTLTWKRGIELNQSAKFLFEAKTSYTLL